MKEIELPPHDAIAGRSTNVYKEYRVLRKHSGDFNIWFKRQYAKQDARCYYCRVSFKGIRINVEHVLPMSKGGNNKHTNLRLSCAPCNKAKGSKKLSKKYISKQDKKVKKQWRRSAIAYKNEKSVQEEIAQSLSWIV